MYTLPQRGTLMRVPKSFMVQLNAYFASSSRRIYSPAEIKRFFYELRSKHHLPQRTKFDEFIKVASNVGQLNEIFLKCPEQYESLPQRYSWGAQFSVYELALSLRKGAYLSHGTAAVLHSLTTHAPGTIYVNKEQSTKPSSGSLTQQGLNNAFAHRQRESRYIVLYGQYRITLLNGKGTGRLGVETMQGRDGELIDVTNIERTLIDITVRPAYSGGVHNVLSSFEAARSRISIDKLVALLRDLDFIYPYHQAIGFYMQRAGYDRASWVALRSQEQNYDFFLAHAMTNPKFDREWRVFYPSGLDGIRTATS